MEEKSVSELILLMQEQHKEQMRLLLESLNKREQPTSIPSFTPFDSTSELWTDYWARFSTFARANNIPDDRLAKVFLTNQSADVYKIISNLASQQTPAKDIMISL